MFYISQIGILNYDTPVGFGPVAHNLIIYTYTTYISVYITQVQLSDAKWEKRSCARVDICAAT